MATAKKTKSNANLTIVRKEPAALGVLRRTADAAEAVFIQAAKLLSTDLAPAELPPIFNTIKDWEDVVADLSKSARDRLLGILRQNGERTTDAGTLRMSVDGWQLEARPRSTGPDAKKLEALLRAKGLSVDTYMQREIRYSVSDDGIARLLAESKLTEAELNTTKPEVSYALQRPKKEE